MENLIVAGQRLNFTPISELTDLDALSPFHSISFKIGEQAFCCDVGYAKMFAEAILEQVKNIEGK